MPDLATIEEQEGLANFNHIVRHIPREDGLSGSVGDDYYEVNTSWEPGEPFNAFARWDFEDVNVLRRTTGPPNGGLDMVGYSGGLITAAKLDGGASAFLDSVKIIVVPERAEDGQTPRIGVNPGELNWYVAIVLLGGGVDGYRGVWELRESYVRGDDFWYLLGDIIERVPDNTDAIANSDFKSAEARLYVYNVPVRPPSNVSPLSVYTGRVQRDIWTLAREEPGQIPITEGFSDFTRTRGFATRWREDIIVGDFIKERIAPFEYTWLINEIRPIGRNRYIDMTCILLDSEIISGALPPIEPPAPPALVWNLASFMLPVWSRKEKITDAVLPAATGGVQPYTYSVTGLPDGITFDPDTRTLSGTPTGVGRGDLEFTVTDSVNQQVDETVPYNTVRRPPLVWNLAAIDLGDWTENQKITDVVLPEASGGKTPYVYSATGLPDGITFTPGTRTLSGIPTKTGQGNIMVSVTDAVNGKVDVSLAFNVIAAPLPPALDWVFPKSINDPDNPTKWDINEKITDIVLPEATGGTAPYTYSAKFLPDGLMFTPGTRTLSGTPTALKAMGDIEFTVTDNVSAVKTVRFFYAVVRDSSQDLDATWTAIQETLLALTVGDDVNIALPLIGATQTTYTSTALPGGLQIQSRRFLRGTVTTPGMGTIRFQATGTGTDKTVDETIMWNIEPLALAWTPTLTGLAKLDTDTAVDITLEEATNGVKPYTYTVTGLPDGLTFTAGTRKITGRPTSTGTGTITAKVTDSDSPAVSITKTVDYAVTAPLPLAWAPTLTGLAKLDTDTAVDITLEEATNGVKPYTYTVTGLPDGLTFTAGTRKIAGTPTGAGTGTITAKVTDSDSPAASITKTVEYAVTAQAKIYLLFAKFLSDLGKSATSWPQDSNGAGVGDAAQFAKIPDVENPRFGANSLTWARTNYNPTDRKITYDVIGRVQYWHFVNGGFFIPDPNNITISSIDYEVYEGSTRLAKKTWMPGSLTVRTPAQLGFDSVVPDGTFYWIDLDSGSGKINYTDFPASDREGSNIVNGTYRIVLTLNTA